MLSSRAKAECTSGDAAHTTSAKKACSAATARHVQIVHLRRLQFQRVPGPEAPQALICRFGPACAFSNAKETKTMLWTICVILLVLWALGMATSYTASGLIHILLVVAVVVMLIRLFSGRRVV
jgi:predicted ferric reductase